MKNDLIVIKAFPSGNLMLIANQPIIGTPVFDAATGLYEVELLKLSIEASARTKAALVKSILSELDFLWRHYAQANDDELTDDAIVLK